MNDPAERPPPRPSRATAPDTGGHRGITFFGRRLHAPFYGWWIVFGSFFIALYSGGAIFYGFTAIIEPLAADLGWSYTQISLAASLRGLEMGLLSPVVGLLTDRFGPRRLILGGSIMSFLGLLLLSRTTSLATFYGAFVLLALGTSASTMTVLMTSVSNWFRRRVGLATGIAICGFGFGGLMVPVIVGLIDWLEWRNALLVLAFGMLAIPLPLSLLFRHRPEQYGMYPDGEPPPVGTPAGSVLPRAEDEGPSPRLREVLRSPLFWVVALAFTCHVLLVSGVVTHIMPYLSSVGIRRATASIIAPALPLTSIVGRLGFGWLADRFTRQRVAAFGFGLMSLGMLSFVFAGSGPGAIVPFLLLFGIGYGGVNVMRAALVQEYFGRQIFGAVFGMIVGVSMVGSLSGPALAGWAFDTWNSYRGLWSALAVVPLGAAAAIAFSARARRPGTSRRPPATTL